jgi:putative DNA primase/helicase
MNGLTSREALHKSVQIIRFISQMVNLFPAWRCIMTDNLTSFRQAMEADGLTPGDIIPGRMQRFPGIGKKNGNTAGWCKLFDDCRGGVYGDFSTDLSKTWQAEQSETCTPKQKAAFRTQVAESRRQAEQAEKESQAKAVSVAAEILQGATGNPGQHPYYLKKGLPLGDHARRGPWPQRGWNDALLFPIFSSDGTIASLQAINADGTKDFLSGGKIKGCFFPLGKISGATGRVIVAEGVATVALSANQK